MDALDRYLQARKHRQETHPIQPNFGYLGSDLYTAAPPKFDIPPTAPDDHQRGAAAPEGTAATPFLDLLQ
jgi:hypothetical protein